MNSREYHCSAEGCSHTVTGAPSLLYAHRREEHPELVKQRKRRKRVVEDPAPEEAASPAQRESELLTNVCDWFDQSALDGEANARVIAYLGARYVR